ncbi:MAG: hypothetical protein K6C08_00250 [Oscillospiraceae bacterium]|nr:hypothetical protein [Oscillospiraceae bacterium]
MKMKNKRVSDLVIACLFCGLLAAVLLAFLLLPERTFSEREKRWLAEKPEWKLSGILSGQFEEDAEAWAADHLPGRDFLVGLSAGTDRFMNLQVTKEIYVGKSGRLYERPSAYSAETIRRNMSILNTFAEAVGQPVDLVLVPSAGFLMRDDITGLKDAYEDDRIIGEACALAGELVRPLELLPVFEGFAAPEELYYRTDHHWTSLGAYLCFREYAAEKGRACLRPEDYTLTKEEGFYGSTYARACFWNIPPESLELWDSGGRYTVRFSDREKEYESVFFPEHLEEADKYPVFLDGNHPLVTIRNDSPDAEGKLLVIRDSYSNCLGCFLADAYESVTLADLRYYRQTLSVLCEEERYDDILFLYSVNNFMSDVNIAMLG